MIICLDILIPYKSRWDSAGKVVFSTGHWGSLHTLFIYDLPPVFCRRVHVYVIRRLFACSGVQHILACVFLRLCCQFLWVVHFWMPLRSTLTLTLTMIHSYKNIDIIDTKGSKPNNVNRSYLTMLLLLF